MPRGTAYHASSDTRIEQALAYGRSHAWIKQHIGASRDDIGRAIRRMDAAVAEDAPFILPGPAHPAVLAALIDAVCPPQPHRAANLRRRGAA